MARVAQEQPQRIPGRLVRCVLTMSPGANMCTACRAGHRECFRCTGLLQRQHVVVLPGDLQNDSKSSDGGCDGKDGRAARNRAAGCRSADSCAPLLALCEQALVLNAAVAALPRRHRRRCGVGVVDVDDVIAVIVVALKALVTVPAATAEGPREEPGHQRRPEPASAASGCRDACSGTLALPHHTARTARRSHHCLPALPRGTRCPDAAAGLPASLRATPEEGNSWVPVGAELNSAHAAV